MTPVNLMGSESCFTQLKYNQKFNGLVSLQNERKCKHVPPAKRVLFYPLRFNLYSTAACFQINPGEIISAVFISGFALVNDSSESQVFKQKPDAV